MTKNGRDKEISTNSKGEESNAIQIMDPGFIPGSACGGGTHRGGGGEVICGGMKDG